MERALSADIDLAPFFDRLAQARRSALIVAYDGCLAPFEAERHRAIPYPGVRERLRSIQRDHGTRLVVVSGRSARELPPLLGLDPAPEIWGSHGLERSFPDGRLHGAAPAREEARDLERGEREARRRGLGGLLERKSGGLALHWRGLDAATARAVEREARRLWEWAPVAGLELITFDGGLELRRAGVTRRSTVATIVREEGAAVVVAYLGADADDEDAFAALPTGGLSVLVCCARRPTGAHLCVQPPLGLLTLLDRWLDARAEPLPHAGGTH